MSLTAILGVFSTRSRYLHAMTTLQKVRQTIGDNELLEHGEAVLVALSGGPDSVALLHILSRLRRTFRLTLGVVYINHGIRPRAAKREERFCRKLCDELGVPLTIVREDIPAMAKKKKLGVEEAAREFRYATFENLARQQEYVRIALGHHADDQAETILFRLVRGTGPAGLVGMPIRRERIIRPLLGLTRAEITEYLQKNSLLWCDDASNRSLRYQRNYVRHRLLPALRSNLNPQVDSALLSLADTLKLEDEFLTGLVDRKARKCLRQTPGGKFSLDLNRYRSYPLWLRRRLLRRCLKAACLRDQFPAKDVVERVDSLALGGPGSLSLPGKVQATVVGESLLICRRQKRLARAQFDPGRKLDLEWPTIRFTGRVLARRQAGLQKKARSRRVWLDWDKLTPPLEVRSAKPGDRFRPLGMRGSKKVGDFLTDCKVPPALRDEVLLLCDKDGLLWLVGFEIADRAKVDTQTKKVLTVAFSVRKTTGRAAV